MHRVDQLCRSRRLSVPDRIMDRSLFLYTCATSKVAFVRLKRLDRHLLNVRWNKCLEVARKVFGVFIAQ